MRLMLIPRQRYRISRQLHFGWYEVCRQGELAERKPGASKLPDYDVENGGVGWWGRGQIFFSQQVYGWRGDVASLSPGRPSTYYVGWSSLAGKTKRAGERERPAKKRGEERRKEIMYECHRISKSGK